MGDGPPVNPWAVWHLRAVMRRVLPRQMYLRTAGRHEQMSMAVWRHVCARLPEGSTVLDIGAFHGEYALGAREVRDDLRVVAFEPNPEAVAVLRTLGRSIEIVEAAVGASTGVGAFTVRGTRSVLRAPSTGEAGIDVEVAELDGLDLGQVALVKIDVERGEADVVAGGRRLFDEHRPIILCEVLRDSGGAHLAEVLPAGYVFFRVDENHGLVPSTVIDRRSWRDKNWLLIPAG